MSITIFTQSKKDFAPIYIRVREGGNIKDGGIDAKARIPFSINPDRLSKGIFKDYKTPKGANAQTKSEYKLRNNALHKTKGDVLRLVNEIQDRLNNRENYEVINSDWLKKVVHPNNKESITTIASDYFDSFYTAKPNLRESTIKKMRSIQKRLRRYEEENTTVYIAEVNMEFKHHLFDWLEKEGYAHNTKVKMLKVIKTVCTHAKDERGLMTHPELDRLTKGESYTETPHIYLTFEDIQKIKDVELKDKHLITARDWLIISCETGQRVSDFLKFSKTNLIKREGDLFIEIQQQKTLKLVDVYLGNVAEILEKYNNDFPPSFSNNADSNETIYNRLIKKVCEKSGINQIVSANLRQSKTNRYEVKEVPKWKAVSSHIGRRSYATNYYGNIGTNFLMDATGHTTEKQFLSYVGKAPVSKALAVASEHKRFRLKQEKAKAKAKLTVVKSIING